MTLGDVTVGNHIYIIEQLEPIGLDKYIKQYLYEYNQKYHYDEKERLNVELAIQENNIQGEIIMYHTYIVKVIDIKQQYQNSSELTFHNLDYLTLREEDKTSTLTSRIKFHNAIVDYRPNINEYIKRISQLNKINIGEVKRHIQQVYTMNQKLGLELDMEKYKQKLERIIMTWYNRAKANHTKHQLIGDKTWTIK